MNLFNFSSTQALIITLIFILVSPFFLASRQNFLSEKSPISWAVPVVASLIFVCIDFRGDLVTGGNIRYLGTIFCIAVFLTINGSTSMYKYSRRLYMFILPLAAISIFGSLYGRINDGEMTGALPFAIPMIILLLHIPRIDLNFNLTRGAQLIIFLCLIISFETILVRLSLLPDKSILVFSHEKSFVTLLGLFLSIAIRNRILIIISSSLISISFALYPAATFPVGFLVALGTYLVANRVKSGVLKLVLVMTYFAIVFFSIFYSKLIFTLTNNYFTLVGKRNNSQYRLSLIEAALVEIQQSPIVGTLFRGSATVQAKVLDNRTYELPVHNDYITIVLCGGVLFLVFFLMIPSFINFRTLRLVSTLHGYSDQRRILIALLASLNVALASSFANPVLINPASSTILYCLIAAIVSLSGSQMRKTSIL
jgi:hypothetical protein